LGEAGTPSLGEALNNSKPLSSRRLNPSFGSSVVNAIFIFVQAKNLCGCKGTKKNLYMQTKAEFFYKNRIKKTCALVYVKKKQ
jgi:hypothetical protein